MPQQQSPQSGQAGRSQSVPIAQSSPGYSTPVQSSVLSPMLSNTPLVSATLPITQTPTISSPTQLDPPSGRLNSLFGTPLWELSPRTTRSESQTIPAALTPRRAPMSPGAHHQQITPTIFGPSPSPFRGPVSPDSLSSWMNTHSPSSSKP